MTVKLEVENIVKVTWETRNFSFEALGRSRQEAQQALYLAWQKHCVDYPDADPTLFEEAMASDSAFIWTHTTLPGATRDYAHLSTGADQPRNNSFNRAIAIHHVRDYELILRLAIVGNHDDWNPSMQDFVKKLSATDLQRLVAAYETFVTLYTAHMGPPPLYEGYFCLDFGPLVKGWHAGQTWNGWGMPHLELEAALEIATLCGGSFDEETLEIRIPYDLTADPEDIDVYHPQIILTTDGLKTVYDIGAGSWTWNIVAAADVEETRAWLAAETAKMQDYLTELQAPHKKNNRPI